MLVTLDIKKHQLRAFQELANLLDIKLQVEPEFTITQEDKALYKAMQEGDQSILSDSEQESFEEWLKS